MVTFFFHLLVWKLFCFDFITFRSFQAVAFDFTVKFLKRALHLRVCTDVVVQMQPLYRAADVFFSVITCELPLANSSLVDRRLRY